MKASAKHKKRSAPPRKREKAGFPVVAIGASLGGLKAMLQLLKHLPGNTGMAYIYVQHLSPDHKSYLTSILSKATPMEVQEIADMEHMEPDNVYVIPYNKGIRVVDGHIKLTPRSKASAAVSIDTLFSSLAHTHKENVVGIVLSGSAKDGTKGLEVIKSYGGITMVQNHTAQAGSMPESAVAAGVADFILSPRQMALQLALFAKKGLKSPGAVRVENTSAESGDLQTVFRLLAKETGVDFSHYKLTTIRRRIQHRMSQINARSLKAYLKLLTSKREEVAVLYKDLLINVTSFFRDKDAFRYLKTNLLPALLKRKSGEQPLRIWVPACSTGEEAYSIAMLVIELQKNSDHRVPVQIFATDLSKQAIRDARIGEYTKSDLENVSKPRVKRFFTENGSTFRVVKELREMCVFAPHNILKDPPFYRIDFISCCNLLIYFDASAQQKALASMHFALNEHGCLMLGRSETTGLSSALFTQVSNKFKIYARKKNTQSRKVPELGPRFSASGRGKRTSDTLTLISHSRHSVNSSELDKLIDSLLLKNYMPACALVNKSMEILQFRGSTGIYLSHSSGKATLNILKMARPEFSLELRSAISQALKSKSKITRLNIEIHPERAGAAAQLVNIEVHPLKIQWDEPLLLIVFSMRQMLDGQPERVDAKQGSAGSQQDKRDLKIKALGSELSKVRAEMHSIIEAQESSYQELQVANEEIVSANEEFQTLNEELETSKEEIEATNEELISTNQELQMRNDLLQESYNYSDAIVNTIHEPMLILNEKLHVKSANKSFYKKFQAKKEETEGKLVFELGNRQWNIRRLAKLLNEVRTKNKEFDDFEVTHTFPVIGERTVLLNARKIIQKNHREQLILLAIIDITERSQLYKKETQLLNEDILLQKEDNVLLEKAVKRRTRQLVQKNRELELANKDLTSFTYISSHDLQEPLHKIQNYVTCVLLEEEKNLSKTGKGYFLRIREIARRMRSLIDDLLKYSRTKSGNLDFEEVELDALLNEVLSDFDEALRESKAQVKVKDLGKARVLPFQFRQLFQNLISNSLKFARPQVAPRISIGGTVIKGADTGHKKLGETKLYLHIQYQDNGIGFEAQYNERIFEVFQRLHSFEEYNGTGIGLAICKRIVENHNGIITASGTLNRGAKFDIYIPLYP